MAIVIQIYYLECWTQLLSLHWKLLWQYSELLHDIWALIGLLVGTIKSLLEKGGQFLSNFNTNLKKQSNFWISSWPTWMAAISLSLFGPLQKSATVLGVALSSARLKALHYFVLMIRMHNLITHLLFVFCSRRVLTCLVGQLVAVPGPPLLSVSSGIRFKVCLTYIVSY